MSRRAATCRSCHAPIAWAVTANGKSMPVDAEPAEDGNVVLEDGVVLRATVLGPLEVPAAHEAGQALHRAHHSTCPDAASWRRDGRA